MGKTEFSHDNCLKFSLQPLRALRSKDIEGLNFQILNSNFLLKLVQSSALHFPAYKPPGSPQETIKISGQKSLLFWSQQRHQKDISELTYL